MKPVLVALAVTFAIQSLTSMAMISPSVMAPVAARDLGLAPQSIGLFVSASYVGAMFSGLAVGGLIARRGAFAVCAAAVVLAGTGLALGAAALVWILPLAGLLIGIGYGFVNPVSSHILARRTPPEVMSLVFSIKQTGVPVGGIAAGALVPTMLLAFGWKATLVALGAVCVAAAAACLPARATLVDPPVPRGPAGLGWRRGLGSMAGPVRLALAHPRLRDLAFASLGYAAVQLVFITYFVALLHLQLGYTLVTAGLVYALAHGSGVVGRIVWGAIADRWIAPRRMLAALGAISALCGVLAAAASSDWPLAAVVAVGMLYGASAVGWNGVYLAEVARSAPPGQVGAATGGTQFFTFGGALCGPPLFASIVWASGSYAWGFGFFALVPVVVAVRLLRGGS
jgi:MFS family permease